MSGDNTQNTRSTDSFERAIADAYAVLVVTPRGRYQRRLYLSLHSADAAMRRARERGQEAACVLVRLVPETGVPFAVMGGEDR